MRNDRYPNVPRATEDLFKGKTKIDFQILYFEQRRKILQYAFYYVFTMDLIFNEKSEKLKLIFLLAKETTQNMMLTFLKKYGNHILRVSPTIFE